MTRNPRQIDVLSSEDELELHRQNVREQKELSRYEKHVAETYPVNVRCLNCNHTTELRIPKGLMVDQYPCPACCCTRLCCTVLSKKSRQRARRRGRNPGNLPTDL